MRRHRLLFVAAVFVLVAIAVMVGGDRLFDLLLRLHGVAPSH